MQLSKNGAETPGSRLLTPNPRFSEMVLQVAASLARARKKMVGVTGFEPVTLRLSSACSNQLSYTPGSKTGSRMDIRTQNGGAEEIRTPDL